MGDPFTGEKALIDKSLTVEDEKALGLQAYEEILSQERPVDPNSQVAQQVREIARRLIAKVDVVEAALAAEHGLQPQRISKDFEWDVNVIQSDQANAFCLPGGKMAVYTGPVSYTHLDVYKRQAGCIHDLRAAHGQVRPALALIGGIGQQARAVLGQPADAILCLQAGFQFTMDRAQVNHVIGGVFQLRVAERTAQPVRTGFTLGQRHAGDGLHQFLVAQAAAYAAQRRSNLRIEQGRRQHAAFCLLYTSRCV